MKKKFHRRSKKQKEYLQTITFFLVTILSITGLITYLWVYTEVDETLMALEIQNSTVDELVDDIKELQSKMEYLQRADVIATKAQRELGMVTARPESITVYIEPNLYTNEHD